MVVKVNFFTINRSLLKHPLWLSEKFSKGQAWVDLIGQANHAPGYLYIRGKKVKINRGQGGHSIKTLMDRWRWSRGKVSRFLSALESDHRIVQQRGTLTTIITICNYELYQLEPDWRDNPDDKSNSHSNDNSNGFQTVTQTITQTDFKQSLKQSTNNKNNNINKKNKKNNNKYSKSENSQPQIQNPYERPPSQNQESQEDKQKREKLIKRMHDFPYPNACIGDLGMNTPPVILEYGLDQTERKQTEIYQETGILDNFRADSYLRKVIENISKEGFIPKDERIEKQEQRLKDTESAKKLDKKMKELININYYYSGLGQTEPHRQKQFNSFSTDIRYDILIQDSDLYLDLNYKASQTIKQKFKTEVILKMMSEKNIRVDQLLKWSISLLRELMKSEKE